MYLHEKLSKQIISAYYEVYNELGFGFLEKVYENALALRRRKAGFDVQQQVPINVYFDGVVVREYYADLVVNNKIIIRTQSCERNVRRPRSTTAELPSGNIL